MRAKYPSRRGSLAAGANQPCPPFANCVLLTGIAWAPVFSIECCHRCAANSGPSDISSASKLVTGSKIGVGSFGEVFSVCLKKDKKKTTYACKELDSRKINRQGTCHTNQMCLSSCLSRWRDQNVPVRSRLALTPSAPSALAVL